MAIVTLATSLSKLEDEYFTLSLGTPKNRLAVPLTSALSLPSSCLSAGLGLIYATGVCSPPYFDEVWKDYGYYSPGVCFSGYSIGCIATATIVNFEPVKPSETAAFCVPRHYECRMYPEYEDSGDLHVVYADPAMTATWISVPAFAIQIRWQSSDSSALGSLYVSSSSGSTSELSNPTAQATSTGITPQASPPEGLPEGLVAAIACTCVALFLILLAACFVFYRKRRQLLAASQLPTTTTETGPPGLPADPEKNWKGAELPATIFEPEPEELPAGEVVSSTPPGWGSAVQDNTPELPESSVPAPTEMPGHQEGQTHAASQSSPATAGMSMPAVAPHQQPTHLTETVEDLITRQAQLEEKRQRLLQLQQIDEEQERIRQQLVALHEQPPPIQRPEMP